MSIYRQNIQFPAKDAALREDVHALGGLVGEILREQGGEELFQRVEGDRVAAIRRREGDPDGAADLRQRTSGRTPAAARDLSRAFSTWFQVVNLAEKVHRTRRRRQYLNDADHPQPGGIADCLQRLKRDGYTAAEVRQMLEGLRIYPVFTAHPTESTRRTMLRKQQRVAELMLERIDPNLTLPEKRSSWERIRTELTSAWQTEDHPRERLTVADEREHVLYYLVEVIYRIVPALYEELAFAMERVFGEPCDPSTLPDFIRCGSWVGGDMDGNADVHAKTLRETLRRHQRVIVNAYFGEVQKLAEQLSQSASRVGVSTALMTRSEEYARRLPGVQGMTPARHDRMPYRVFLGQVAERLRATYEALPEQYESATQFAEDIRLVAESLAANSGRAAGLFYVQRLLRRVGTFGFHLATIDVRQHAEVHHQVLAQGLADPDWCARAPAERAARLAAVLDGDLGPVAPLDAIGRRTLGVFEAMGHARHRFGRTAIGEYVISGTRGVDDVLAVLVLARWADVLDQKTGQAVLDAAPLLETIDMLEGAGALLEALCAVPAYQRHLEARGRRQVVQLGYPDSGKDGGLVASRWAIHVAQQQLAATARNQAVHLTLFHGRGGAVSRGAARTDVLVRSAPPGAFRGELRVTEQGEVVSHGYGLKPIAMRTFEQAFHAVMLASTPAATAREEDPEYHVVMRTFAAASRDAWQRLVYGSPDFHRWFRQVTPLDAIERMQIGSRPAMRLGGQGLTALRAVPWAFAWSQARFFLPGWYGVGTGLDAALAAHGHAAVESMLARWPFFSGLLDDVEQQLATTDLEIASFYAQLAEPGLASYLAPVQAEYTRTVEHLLRLKGESRLLDGDPTIQRAIKLRNPYVDPMHLMQVDLLQRWRASGREDRDLFEALLASISGIAQGLQATG